MKLLSTLARIQRSRVLYTYDLGVDDGDRNDGHSNKLSPAGAVMQANVCAMNACKIRTSKCLQQVHRCSNGETFEGYDLPSLPSRRHCIVGKATAFRSEIGLAKIYLVPIQRARFLFRPWLVTFSGIALVLGAIGTIYLNNGESLAI